MTKSLLLEIGLEEIPAQYVRSSVEQLGKRIATFLDEAHLSYGETKLYATPRRLAVMIQEVEEQQQNRTEIFKGPSLAVAQQNGEWTKAAQGFVRGKGLSVEDIYVESVSGVDYIHVKKEVPGQQTIELLKDLSTVIQEMTFPVTMRWADHSFEYIRPIHWIVGLFGDEVIPHLSVLSIEAGRQTRGHRFLGKAVDIAFPEQYEEQLKAQYVIADQDERKEMIRHQMQQLEQEKGWSIPQDEELLEEVSSILEYPTVFYGSFDETYLQVPAPILVTSMKEHQRYFVVYNEQGELLPYFISARNGNANSIENVAKGNQKVLTARLEDALFFFNEDKKEPIEFFLNKLSTLNFHAKIGTMTEKMNRVSRLVQLIGESLGLQQADIQTAIRASHIYKFDLVTNVVGEFPELQGIMGDIYAVMKGETEAVGSAIREHYLPTSAGGELPQSVPGALLAIADKLDTVLAFIAIGLTPTGSNDPYALRRQAMGIVSILDQFEWHLSWFEFMVRLLDSEYTTITLNDAAREQLKSFMTDRIAQRLQHLQARHDVIEAVLNGHTASVPAIVESVKLLEKARQQSDFKQIIESLTRVVNLGTKESDVTKVEGMLSEKVNAALIETKSEQALLDAIIQLEHKETLSIQEQFDALKAMKPLIVEYFNQNMIMVDNEDIRKNRVMMLQHLAKEILKVANVSQLIVK